MKAYIYKPCANIMQSGVANVAKWLLVFEQDAENKRFISPVMGWSGASDMNQEITLKFDTKEEAIAYAEREGLEYETKEPKIRKIIPKNYADNFSG